MAFVTGTTYSVSLNVNAAIFKWSYSIYNGLTTVSGSAINFRGVGTSTDAIPWPDTLCVAVNRRGDDTSEGREDFVRAAHAFRPALPLCAGCLVGH